MKKSKHLLFLLLLCSFGFCVNNKYVHGQINNEENKIFVTGSYYSTIITYPTTVRRGQYITIKYKTYGSDVQLPKINNNIQNSEFVNNSNINFKAVPIGNPVITDFYLGTETNDKYMFLKSSGKYYLESGSVILKSISFYIPSDISIGNYYLVATVGTEINKVPINITYRNDNYSIITNYPNPVYTNEVIQINYTVYGPNLQLPKNKGGIIVPVGDPVGTEFYLGTSSNNKYRFLLFKTNYVENVLQTTTSLTIPNDISAGSYYLVTIVGDRINKVPITIKNESLTISNVTINNTSFDPGQTLSYSYKVSGDLMPGSSIWSNVSIVYADGTSSQVLNQMSSSYNTTINGNYTLPAKYGNATLKIKVSKYYNSIIQSAPTANAELQFTINDNRKPGNATISNIKYKNNWTGSTTLYIYNGEGIDVEFDLDNTGEKDVEVTVYTIWTPSSVSDDEMVLNNTNTINSYYFQNNIMDSYNIGALAAGGWTYVTLSPYVGNSECPSSGSYTLWTFTCNYDDVVFDFKKVNFTFNENDRPTKSYTLEKSSNKYNEYVEDVNGLEAYPNPSNGLFKLDLPADKIENSSLEVFSLSGSKVYSTVITESTNQIDLTHLNSGTYLIKLSKDGIIYSEKLQIRK